MCFSHLNDNLKNLITSIHFMSDKFVNFGKQLQILVLSMKEIREKNRELWKQDIMVNSEIVFLKNSVNVLKQNSVECCIEIIDVP